MYSVKESGAGRLQYGYAVADGEVEQSVPTLQKADPPLQKEAAAPELHARYSRSCVVSSKALFFKKWDHRNSAIQFFSVVSHI